MLLGHFGVGFATKRVTPKAPLWSLLVASQVADLLSFCFASVGLESFEVSHADLQHGVQVEVLGSVPWSHGLLMSVFVGILVVPLPLAPALYAMPPSVSTVFCMVWYVLCERTLLRMGKRRRAAPLQ